MNKADNVPERADHRQKIYNLFVFQINALNTKDRK